ncbi:hypothetical protein BC832DRAFT_594037 [Gaertneriomyces semiglobifer]|nr:hypothetical protein BC832DRAFT_594037 [Gaertneriomyces semiglobifer]
MYTQAAGPAGQSNVPASAGQHVLPHVAGVRRRVQKGKPTIQAHIVENEPPIPLGDEVDLTVARAVAFERYKRNHEFLDCIFSPHPIASIVPSGFADKVDTALIADIQRRTAETEAEVAQLQVAYKRDIETYISDSKKLTAAIESIKNVATVEEVNQLGSTFLAMASPAPANSTPAPEMEKAETTPPA